MCSAAVETILISVGQTWSAGMSQKLLDHLVGGHEQVGRHLDAASGLYPMAPWLNVPNAYNAIVMAGCNALSVWGKRRS